MEKQPKVKELYQMLTEGVSAVYSSDAWRELLTFHAQFHKYSFKNTVLILSQFPTARRVAGYDTWNKLGRKVVKKGGIKIIAPHTYEQIDPVTKEKEVKLGFHQATVFDISQTAGKDIPTICHELQGDTQRLRQFYAVIKELSTVPIREITMGREHQGSKGFYHIEERYIAIKKGLSYLHKCKTAIHEIVHAEAHFPKGATESDTNREMMEVEAEGTAFVVLSYFGFDTSEYSFPYVATWNKGKDDTEMILKAGENIHKQAHRLITALETKLNVDQSA